MINFEDLQNCSTVSDNIPETIELCLGFRKIIKFTTLTHKHLHAIYNSETTIGDLINKFLDNYSCEYLNRENLIFYSNQLKIKLCDQDVNTKLSSYGLNKISNVTLYSTADMRLYKDVVEFDQNLENIQKRITELRQQYEMSNVNDQIIVRSLWRKNYSI